jgi:hypothetical protein
MKGQTMKTLIGIQDEYIQTVIAGAGRWSHRPTRNGAYRFGGHFPRIVKGAHSKAAASLKQLGFTDEQAEKAIADAYAMVKLELNAE